jgi:hypothetical protein
MDLNDLVKPLAFPAPPLGELQVDVLSDDFGAWFETWDTPAADPLDLVRALLRDQARTAGPEGVAIDAAQVAALPDPDLDAVAATFVFAAGGYMRPRYISEGVGERRKVRKRTAQEAYDLGPLEGERPAAQLLRLMRDWREDRKRQEWLVTEPARRATRDLMRAFGGVRAFQHAMEQQLKFQLSPGFKLALEAARGPSLGGALQEIARHEQSIATRIAGLKLGVMAFDDQRARLDDLFKAARPTVPDLKVLGLYPDIGASIAQLKIGVVDPTAFDAVRRLEESIGRVGRETGDRQREILAGADVFRQANRLFDLGIPAAAFAAMTALPAVGLGGLTDTKLSMFPPGFQVTATLGVAGPLSRGAVADVLHHYGEEPSPEQPVFGGALEATARIDAGPDGRRELIAWFERFAAMAMAAVRNEADVIRRAGLLVLLGLVFQAVSTWNDVFDDGATSADVAQVTERLDTAAKEMGALRSEVAGLRADRADESLRIRFVHSRAPLRREPHREAPLMRHVYPDQRLRVIDERGDWVLAEVFNYHGETLERGWIARARLRQRPLD